MEPHKARGIVVTPRRLPKGAYGHTDNPSAPVTRDDSGATRSVTIVRNWSSLVCRAIFRTSLTSSRGFAPNRVESMILPDFGGKHSDSIRTMSGFGTACATEQEHNLMGST